MALILVNNQTKRQREKHPLRIVARLLGTACNASATTLDLEIGRDQRCIIGIKPRIDGLRFHNAWPLIG